MPSVEKVSGIMLSVTMLDLTVLNATIMSVLMSMFF